MRGPLAGGAFAGVPAAAGTPAGVHGCRAPWQAPPVEASQSWTVAADCLAVRST